MIRLLHFTLTLWYPSLCKRVSCLISPDLELEGPLIEDMRIRGGGRASESANSLSGGGGRKSSNDKNNFGSQLSSAPSILRSKSGYSLNMP